MDLRKMLQKAVNKEPALLLYTCVVMSLRETLNMSTEPANIRIRARLRIDSDKMRAYKVMDKIIREC